MAVLIEDKFLAAAGLSEDEARVEIACRLFESGTFDRKTAQDFCGLDPVAFWRACGKRQIDVFGYSSADLDLDLKQFDQIVEQP